MNPTEEFSSTHLNNYHFPPWSNSIHRPHSPTLNRENPSNENRSLSIDNRSSSPETTKTKKKIIRHHVRIPTFSRISSPVLLPQRTVTPDLLSTNVDQTVMIALDEHRSTPIQLKSTEMNLQITTKKTKNSTKNFPKQTFEHNQLTFERKKRKQQSQMFVDKYSTNETWFHLRKSLAEFKRLSTNENVSLPTKSESNGSLSLNSTRNQSKRIRSTQGEIYPRRYIDPLLVASKPIHSSTKIRQKSSRIATSSRLTSSMSRKSSPEKRRQYLSSELSEVDRLITPSPRFPLRKDLSINGQQQRRITSATVTSTSTSLTQRLPSSIEFHPKSEFLPKPPIRSRSANDIKTIHQRVKTPSMPRFLIVADEEHRIESWFHQYPFVLADELIKLFRTKNSSKITLSAYFLDEYQTSNPNSTAKTFFQGKSFHIHHDWKKFDLIFVSKPVSDEIIGHLQNIFQSLKSMKKVIPIYRVDHQNELKKQIKNQCRLFQSEHNEKEK